MLIGENGILTQAQKAKERTENATVEEQKQIAMAEAAMNLDGEEYKSTYNNNEVTVPIPAGFAVSQVPGENTVDDGLVIIDSKGNEFVWVPVINSDSYVRNNQYPCDENDENLKKLVNGNGYLPTLEDEVNISGTEEEKEKYLVTNKGGFYISRYEAGDGSATSLSSRTQDSGITGELVSKKNAYIYNYIKPTEAQEKAKTFEVKDSTKVKSGLITGIQWDMVMKFVNGKIDGNGKDKFDATIYSPTRHLDTLMQSGQNEADKVCNIYDLEGNCYEITAELCHVGDDPYFVERGGTYKYTSYGAYTDGASIPASHRYRAGNGYLRLLAYRFVLYVM